MVFSSKLDDVDYILVSNKCLTPNEEAKRKSFERELKYKGLKIDHEEIENLIFTKLSLPDDIKYKYFEILELRMPLKMEEEYLDDERQRIRNIRLHPEDVKFLKIIQKIFLINLIQKVLKRLKNYYLHEDDDLTEIMNNQYFASFKDKQQDLFDLESPYAKKKIWNILVINHILSRLKCDSCVGDFIGIEAMIEKKIFITAFPLHDGSCEEEGTMRTKLYKLWGRLYFWKNLPPLDDMRDYLGNTCAVYFAWLEFYTKMLFLASMFGILPLVYGLTTLPADKFSNNVCGAKNVTMCPVCDYICDYYPLSSNCVYARTAHLFDNDFTIVYSTLMALWTSVLGGLWMRRNKVLQRKWNLVESIDEKTRIQYIRDLETYREVTRKYDANKIPTTMKFMAITLSTSIIFFFIVLVAIAIVSMMMYEIWVTGVVYSSKNLWMLSHDSFIISFTSSLLNLFTIITLNTVYSNVAVFLNDREFHRTSSEYNRALTVKKFAFQFINTYASILYIALIKGKFNGFPGHYNRIFGFRQSECKNGGCLMELSIQLATIMIGKQIIESFGEFITAFFKAHLKQSGMFSDKDTRINIPLKENVHTNNPGKYYQEVKMTGSRLEEDYNLLDFEKEGGFFNEYLKLAIQYGFVILFTPAFPLAPLFAWIRNIFEIRFDAAKILLFHRRLVPHLNPNMMIWLEIFNFMGNISVLINAIVIAFTTNIITRLTYSWYNNGNNTGYFNSTLSAYNTSDLDRGSIPESSTNVTVCYYSDFREPYWSPRKYEPTVLYWHTLVAKFVFIIFYQNLILKWIPETPGRLHQFQKDERDFILSSMEPRDHEGSQESSESESDSEANPEPSNIDSDKIEKQLEDVAIIGLNRLKSFSDNSEAMK